MPRSPDGARRFESLGGYPTRAQAEAALADALARRSHGFLLDSAKLTVNQYLDRWLTHIRTNRRARTVARYTALLRDHVRPSIGARPLKQLTPLEVQAIYDHLVVSGRRDGKPGGLAPQHILAVHRCLHRALAQAVTWRLLAHNPATHATPPPVPRTEVAALAPEQVAVLLDAAACTTSPWLGPWTVLAAATGARNGELCGLEWADLNLDTSTIQFRQALTIIDPTILSDDADGDGGAGVGGGRKELVVGPLKSTASNAMLGGRCRLGVGRRESGGKASPRTRLDWAACDRIAAGQGLCGRDRIRTCVGNAGDFTGRTAVSSRVPSHPSLVPIIARDVHKRHVDSFGRHSAFLPVPARPVQPGVGRREGGGKAGRRSDQSSAPMCGGRRRFDPSGRRNTLPTKIHQGILSLARVVTPAPPAGHDHLPSRQNLSPCATTSTWRL